MQDIKDPFHRLVAIVKKLRDPDEGCPWDLEQTRESMKQCLLEEAHEVIESIEMSPEDLREELGDLMLVIVFYAQLSEEDKHFNVSEVLDGICDKLIRRHPHVFGDISVDNSKEVLKNWEAIKKKEKTERKSILDGIAKTLPALQKAEALGTKAARVNFDWKDAAEATGKIEEELGELITEIRNETPSAEAIEEEFGDLLFIMAQLARKLGFSPEIALQKTCVKFRKRFNRVEELAGDNLGTLGIEGLDPLWEQAKNEIKNGGLS